MRSTRDKTPLGSVALALALIAPTGSSAPVQRPSVPETTPVIQLLAESPCENASDYRTLVRQLESLGASSFAELFRIYDLTRRPVGVSIDDTVRPAKPDAVHEALVGLSHRVVVQNLELVVAGSDRLRTYESALLLLGESGREGDMQLALGFAEAASKLNPQRGREAFRACLEGILSREPLGQRILTATYGRAPAGLRSTIVRTAAAHEPVDARRTLSGLLELDPPVDALILSEITRLGTAPNVDQNTALRVRACLRRPDPTVRALAAIVCARLDDDRAVEDLIGLLRDEDAGVRANAYESLRDITRLGFHNDLRTWEAWYAGESEWWEDTARSTLAALPTLQAAQAAQEIQRLARRRLFRREIAAALAECLSRDDPDIVRLACATLGDFGFPESVPALVRCLDYPEIKVRKAARAALLRITHPEPSMDRLPVMPL
jgi:hypothetical protein